MSLTTIDQSSKDFKLSTALSIEIKNVLERYINADTKHSDDE